MKGEMGRLIIVITQKCFVLFCSLMAAVRVNFRHLHSPFCMQLQQATSMYVCNYNWLIHQHCL